MWPMEENSSQSKIFIDLALAELLNDLSFTYPPRFMLSEAWSEVIIDVTPKL